MNALKHADPADVWIAVTEGEREHRPQAPRQRLGVRHGRSGPRGSLRDGDDARAREGRWRHARGRERTRRRHRRSRFGSRRLCFSGIRMPVPDRHPPILRRMLPSVLREPKRHRPRILAAPSPHDLHDRVDDPAVQQHIPDRDTTTLIGGGTPITSPSVPEHVVLGHQVVLADRRVLRAPPGRRPTSSIASACTGIPPFATTTTRFSNSPRIITYPAGIQRFDDQEHQQQDVRHREQDRSDDGVGDAAERQRREEVHDQREHRADDANPQRWMRRSSNRRSLPPSR